MAATQWVLDPSKFCINSKLRTTFDDLRPRNDHIKVIWGQMSSQNVGVISYRFLLQNNHTRVKNIVPVGPFSNNINYQHPLFLAVGYNKQKQKTNETNTGTVCVELRCLYRHAIFRSSLLSSSVVFVCFKFSSPFSP